MNEDVTGQIDLNPALMLERLDNWLDAIVKLLPNLVAAIIVLVIAYLIAALIRRLIVSSAKRKSRDNLGENLGGLARFTVIILGWLLAATIVFPSLSPGDLFAGLGVSSVAIGFAFKDILQNWLAGLLLLIRQPFEIGDQIIINGYEGTVEQIETRATLIKTYSGERAVVPNSDIYTNAVLVKTAFPIIRSQYDVGIGYGDDIAEATDVMIQALKNVAEIDHSKSPEVLVWGLDASWVTLRVRWWTKSPRAEVVNAQSKVIGAIKQALDEAGIDMPYETRVQLFHDQTEAIDGDRTAQREGWPAPKSGSIQPRWKVRQDNE